MYSFIALTTYGWRLVVRVCPFLSGTPTAGTRKTCGTPAVLRAGIGSASARRDEGKNRQSWQKRAYLVVLLAVLGTSPQYAMARAHWTVVDPGTAEPAGLLLAGNIFFTDARHGVVLGRVPVPRKPVRPGIAWTRDGGHSWHSAKIRADVKKINLAGLWFSSARVGWADGGTQGRPSYGILLKTRDGGRIWRTVALPKTIGGLGAVWFGPHGQHGRLLPHRGTFFWQTADGGKTFTRVNVGHTFQGGWWIGSWKKMVLAVAGGRVIIRTDNAGKTWAQAATGLKGPAASISAISFAKGGKAGWAVGGQGKWLINSGFWLPHNPVILHTVDGGKTWTLQTPPAGRTGNLTDVYAISPREAWVGSVLGYARTNPMTALPWLLHTTDGGKTWPDVFHHVVSVRKLFFLNARHGWAVGGGGGGSPYEPNGVVLIYGGR